MGVYETDGFDQGIMNILMRYIFIGFGLLNIYTLRKSVDNFESNPQNRIAMWDLRRQGITPTVAKSLAAYVAVSASLTSLNVEYNTMGEEGRAALRKAAEGRSGFELML